ncbi:hypothetical protein GEMRC1_000659 [Eukaryota sp. GEM-RC1]
MKHVRKEAMIRKKAHDRHIVTTINTLRKSVVLMKENCPYEHDVHSCIGLADGSLRQIIGVPFNPCRATVSVYSWYDPQSLKFAEKKYHFPSWILENDMDDGEPIILKILHDDLFGLSTRTWLFYSLLVESAANLTHYIACNVRCVTAVAVDLPAARQFPPAVKKKLDDHQKPSRASLYELNLARSKKLALKRSCFSRNSSVSECDVKFSYSTEHPWSDTEECGCDFQWTNLDGELGWIKTQWNVLTTQAPNFDSWSKQLLYLFRLTYTMEWLWVLYLTADGELQFFPNFEELNAFLGTTHCQDNLVSARFVLNQQLYERWKDPSADSAPAVPQTNSADIIRTGYEEPLEETILIEEPESQQEFKTQTVTFTGRSLFKKKKKTINKFSV